MVHHNYASDKYVEEQRNPNIKKCIICKRKIKRKDSLSDYHFKIKKYCSFECLKIGQIIKYKKYKKAYRAGMLFECRLKNILEEQGWHVFRTLHSRGIIDLIAFKDSKVRVIQAKTSTSEDIKGETIRILKKFKKKNSEVIVELITEKEKVEIE